MCTKGGLAPGCEITNTDIAHSACVGARIVGFVEESRHIRVDDPGDDDPQGPDTVVDLLDAVTGQERHKLLIKQASNIEAVAFSPDGKTLAVGRGWNDPDIHLYNVAGGREIGVVTTPPHTHTSLALAFTPDGKQLVTGMSDTSVLIWDLSPRD